jgi:hypothetical protein
MKVQELIKLLREREAEVLVWADGVRYPLSEDFPVDHFALAFVDLNIVTVREVAA